MSKQEISISDSVLSEIKSGKVKMRPAIYFSLISIGIVLSGVLAGIALAYSSSAIFLWFKVLNAESAAYGMRRNLAELMTSFPWWTLVILAITIVFLVYLIKTHGSAYKHKAVTVILLILAFATISGFVMSSFDIGFTQHDGSSENRDSQRGGPWWQD